MNSYTQNAVRNFSLVIGDLLFTIISAKRKQGLWPYFVLFEAYKEADLSSSTKINLIGF